MPPKKEQMRVEASDFDLDQLRKLGELGLPPRTVAWWFGVSSQHFDKCLKVPEVEKAYNLGRARLHRTIAAKQLELAENGHAGMLIHLGKCLLGQVETSRTEHTGKDGAPLEIDFDETRREITSLINGIAKRAREAEATK
jgi:hypothetical protein